MIRILPVLLVLAGCKPALRFSLEARCDGSNGASVVDFVQRMRPALEACYDGAGAKSSTVVSLDLDRAGKPTIWFKPQFDTIKCVAGVLTKLTYPPAPDEKRTLRVKIVNATDAQREDGYGSDMTL